MKRRRRHHNQGKRSKARRAYTDEPDEMVEARRSGLTQERSDSLRRRWLRAEERRFELTKVAKFAKPVAPPKPKGRTNRQRRNERRKRPEPPAESWPTNRAVRRAEDAVGWDEAAAELGVAAAAAAATQKEEEEEAAAEPVEASLDDDDDDDDDVPNHDNRRSKKAACISRGDDEPNRQQADDHDLSHTAQEYDTADADHHDWGDDAAAP